MPGWQLLLRLFPVQKQNGNGVQQRRCLRVRQQLLLLQRGSNLLLLVFFSACHNQNAAALMYDPYPVFLWDHDRKSGNSCLKT